MRRLSSHRLFWPACTLLLLLAVNAVFNPGFWQLQWRDGHLYGSLVDIVNRAAPLAIVALGLTLVIATRGIDISVGAVVAISGAVAALMIGGDLKIVDGQAVHITHWPLSVALMVALVAAAACGAWNGLLVARAGLQPIIATLIMMLAGRGAAQLLTGGQIITVYYAPYFFLGNGFLLGLPFTLTLVLAMLGLTAVLTRRTALGLFIEAVGDNETASHFTGLPARQVKFLAYVFAGLCAGLAGLVAASNIKCADSNHAGLYLELDAILAVVIGGTSLTGGRFYLAGSMIGALLIQTLTQTLYMRNVSADIAPVPKAIVILAVCLLQSPKLRDRLAKLGKRKATA